MAVESASYINSLNASNPAASDSLKEADDHLRLIKSVLKQTFPNITGAVTSTHNQLSNPFPVGGIIMWSGSIASIPSGWGLCNGTSYNKSDGSGTIASPDLRDRFIVGAGLNYAVATTGGLTHVNLLQANLPAHNHVISVNGTVVAAGGHTHTITDPGHSHVVKGFAGGAVAGPNTSFDAGTVTYSTDAATTGITIDAAADHTHGLNLTASSASVGGDLAHENRPPFYALAYIMKL